MISDSQGNLKPSQVLQPYQELQINPPLPLGMEVRGRLIRTADKVVLFDNTWKYEGGSRLFTEWAAHVAYPFAEEFVTAYGYLANQIVDTIFKSPLPEGEGVHGEQTNILSLKCFLGSLCTCFASNCVCFCPCSVLPG